MGLVRDRLEYENVLPKDLAEQGDTISRRSSVTPMNTRIVARDVMMRLGAGLEEADVAEEDMTEREVSVHSADGAIDVVVDDDPLAGSLEVPQSDMMRRSDSEMDLVMSL